MLATSSNDATQAQVTDALARVREAIVLAGEQEISRALNAEEPCEQTHTAEDAAVRLALLKSEDAMLSVLETLPPTAKTSRALLN